MKAQALFRIPLTDLHRKLRRRQWGVKSLHRRRARLLAKIAAIDDQILAAGASRNGAVSGRMGRSTRRKNDTNLIRALQRG